MRKQFLKPDMTVQGHIANAIWLLILTSVPQSSTGSLGRCFTQNVSDSPLCSSSPSVYGQHMHLTAPWEMPSCSHLEVMVWKANRIIKKTAKSIGCSQYGVRREICLLSVVMNQPLDLKDQMRHQILLLLLTGTGAWAGHMASLKPAFHLCKI